MLKKFFMNLLSSFVGAWIALALFGAVAIIVVIGLMAKLGNVESGVGVSKKSILKLELSGPIDEIESAPDFSYQTILNGRFERPRTLATIVKALEEGAVNENISALYIECGGVAASPATLNAIREAVIRFKESSKKVYAYGDALTLSDLYVASVSDSLFVNPGGEVYINGINGTVVYMKDLFDKLGVNFQVVKVGTFKSAVEPYTMSEMSTPARAQLDTLYGNMWKYMRTQISKSRKGLTPAAIDSLVSRDLVSFAPLSVARKANLFDKELYGRKINDILGRLVGKDPDKLNFVRPEDLVSQTNWGTAYGSKRKIAVLYATGEIVDGAKNGIDFKMLVPQIIKLADDDNVKGMVLRVNSPGGSAFGSEQIGEALDYFMSKGKKLAVSMGDYAASGGYWISAGADRIFADPLTITGSIGIFGLIPNVEGLASKVGINPQTVGTNPDADFPNMFKNMNPRQQSAMQSYVERGYDRFIKRVAIGRKMKESYVRKIGEGRVWDAVTAKKIGLIDQLGGLRDAVDWVALKSGLKGNYDVAVYPQSEPSFWDYMPAGAEADMIKALSQRTGCSVDEFLIRKAARVLGRKPVQALMPVIEFDF